MLVSRGEGVEWVKILIRDIKKGKGCIKKYDETNTYL